ncbi:MAG TPA: N-acetyl-1-D-myo-inositol-2-amino-2-deoxy-alpha-D-glucopyranoside deacetylase [Streptosporangiaceae bacterium]
MFVHAHPDDESIETGATMALYAARGAAVTLVTCTLGEEGEVIPPELAHLAADRDDTLGEHRIGELRAACAALGVADHRFLGGAGRWRDSGMMGTPSTERPECFWRADADEADTALVAIIREVRPQVIVSYDERGYYGHPDHIQAYRVTRRAFGKAADPEFAPGTGHPWRPLKLYATAMPRSALVEGLELQRSTANPFTAVGSVDDLPYGVPDEQVTARVDGRAEREAKIAAMRAHATQISVSPPFYALSNGVGQELSAVEHYTRLVGAAVPGVEDDLFAGV